MKGERAGSHGEGAIKQPDQAARSSSPIKQTVVYGT